MENHEINVLVGKMVQRLRKQRGLSQAQLAAALRDEGLNISSLGVSNKEKGICAFSFIEMMLISYVLDIDIGGICWRVLKQGEGKEVN